MTAADRTWRSPHRAPPARTLRWVRSTWCVWTPRERTSPRMRAGAPARSATRRRRIARSARRDPDRRGARPPSIRTRPTASADRSPIAPQAGRERPRRAWCHGSTTSSCRAATRAVVRIAAVWNSSGGTPNWSGAPPTSFSAIKRGPPVIGGVLDPLGHDGAAVLLEPLRQLGVRIGDGRRYYGHRLRERRGGLFDRFVEMFTPGR